jgi:hypothetical protein
MNDGEYFFKAQPSSNEYTAACFSIIKINNKYHTKIAILKEFDELDSYDIQKYSSRLESFKKMFFAIKEYYRSYYELFEDLKSSWSDYGELANCTHTHFINDIILKISVEDYKNMMTKYRVNFCILHEYNLRIYKHNKNNKIYLIDTNTFENINKDDEFKLYEVVRWK